MKIWVVSLFSEFEKLLLSTGVVGRALSQDKPLLEINWINPCDFSEKGHKNVDSSPYGGGAGQVMRADVLENCLIQGIFKDRKASDFHIIYLGPRGRVFDQMIAKEYAQTYLSVKAQKELVFICGRYEGIDERFIEAYVDEHLSLGDFVLSGGELALLPVLDATIRLLPGVLGNSESPIEESFQSGLLEYPQYTKPQIACEKEVPKVLLSGHHENVKKWRNLQRLNMTKKYRPDLLKDKSE